MTMTGLAYHCAAGDTFDGVALRLYGHENYAQELMAANPALCGTTVFSGGEILLLPLLDIPERSAERAMANTIAPWRV